MPDATEHSVMDAMIVTLKEQNLTARIHLKNGIRLTGRIIAYDAGGIHLSGDDDLGIAISRSAISSVQKNTNDPKSQGGRPTPRT